MKNYRLLLASVVLFVFVYAKEYSWAHLGSTGFWIVGFGAMIYCFVLSMWVLVDLGRWILNTKPRNPVWSILVALGLIIVSIYGMR